MERIGDVMRMCCAVSSNWQMKAAVRNSGKGAVVAGGSAFLGGLLLGPAGIAVGGAVGGLLGWGMTSGQFKPVPQILMELPPQQQRKLYSDVMAVLGSLDWTDAVQLIALVMGNSSMQERVITAILTYLRYDTETEHMTSTHNINNISFQRVRFSLFSLFSCMKVNFRN
ncbi:protein C19orf12 homolog [Pangasianodon hypophthalmus]|uniref:protein C19orf12 homolog n=1 Tax=Pangasianodon hypophthalmus TaxID=310915 RepID=UPI0023082706|nr:protein C19orf12 homolog [Pangasianodon hypophthalmus]XP_053085549.1 protein C19orf12 homolog [Pangasianodon hypophthalmus]